MADDWTPIEEPGSGTWLDTAKNVAQTADDAVRAAANAVTFGMADRLAGYMGGGVDAEVAKSQAARERSPYASIAGDVGGAVALPGFGAAGLAARMGGGALARGAAYGGTGILTGAAQGAGNTYTGELPDYVKNAAIGGALGGTLGAAGGAIFGRGPAVSAAKTPTVAEQEAAKTAAYKALETHPAQYMPQALAQRADDIEAYARARRFHEDRSPQSFGALGEMRAPPTVAPGTPVRPGDIDYIRKGITGDPIAGATPTELASAKIVKRGIDDFLRKPPPGAAVPGTEHLAADASRVANTAHQLYAGLKRTEAMEELIRNAGRTAGATHSGLNLRNELQKSVRTGLKEKKGESTFSRAGYNPAEIAEFERFSRGQGALSNVLGYTDKYLGGGGGLGALVAGGIGGKALSSEDDGSAIAKGVGVSALGLGLRTLGNRRAAADINRMRDLIAQRNPLYEARAARAPMVPGAGSPVAAQVLRDAMALELLKQRTSPSQKYESW
jgi:hypothetical protein